MAIKALKQNVSICEIQKMIHQWKNRGINDPTVTKLLDLHLGMPAYMNESGIYPLCNFYYILKSATTRLYDTEAKIICIVSKKGAQCIECHHKDI